MEHGKHYNRYQRDYDEENFRLENGREYENYARKQNKKNNYRHKFIGFIVFYYLEYHIVQNGKQNELQNIRQ